MQSPLVMRVMLDSGSISPTRPEIHSTCHWKASSDRDEKQTCGIVKAGMEMRDGQRMELTLFTVPLICEPLTGQLISLCTKKYEHLAQLDLANNGSLDNEDHINVDILIGSDYYWELATGKTCRDEEGPVAIHTKLGWILSGPVQSPDPY